MPSVVYRAGVGGGTEHYRCRTPGSALARAGWDVRYANDGASIEADVVVLQRVLHPAVPVLVGALRAAGCRVIFDIDDWYDGIPAYNPASNSIDQDDLDLLHRILESVDLITVTTDELAEGYAPFGETVVLPNYLDPDTWRDADRYRHPRSKIHVGWLGSATWRGADVNLLRPWLADWLTVNPDAEFVVAGSDPSLLRFLKVEGLLCPPARGHVRPYEHLPAMLGWFDIGLVPLTFNRFNQAKSWCKGMEYAAAGVSSVASPSREYRKFIKPGVNGFLVRHDDWPGALDKAVANLDQLRLGAVETAKAHQIDLHIHRWVEAYEGVLRG